MIDIRPRAALALDHYSRFLDPRLGDVPWFYARLTAAGSFAEHCEWDFGDATGRFLDAALLCRRIVGPQAATREHEDAIERLAASLSRMFENGLCWRPSGFTWVQHAANMFDQRSALYGLITWLVETGDARARSLIDQQLARFQRILADRGDWAFFPYEDYRQGDEHDAAGAAFDFRIDPLHYGGGVLIAPLVLCYKATGDERALLLASKLARFVVDHSTAFDEDGGFWSRNRSFGEGHVHSRVATVCGILSVARHACNDRLTGWCGMVFDWARTVGSSWGWFPEGLYRPEYKDLSRHSETCCTTDMIDLAIGLARGGRVECWDYAERFACHLLASQVTDVSWARDGSDRAPSERVGVDDIASRYRGAFTGRTRPDDLFNNGVLDTMGCCAAAGGQGLSRLWENAVDDGGSDGGEVRVNLWMPRAGRSVDVTAAAAAGAVSGPAQAAAKAAPGLLVRVNKSCRLSIRAPGWAAQRSLRVSVDGKPRPSEARDGWIRIGSVRPGARVLVEASGDRRETSRVAGDDYDALWQGNDLAGLTRRMAAIPLYPEAG